MADNDEVMMPMPTQAALRQAELLTLRQISDNLKNMYDEQLAQRQTLAGVKEDVTVLKVQSKAYEELAASVDKLKERCAALEIRNAKQDGATTLLTFLKDFGPWIVGLIGLGWGLLKGP